jgi:uracil-DNA glycosylase
MISHAYFRFVEKLTFTSELWREVLQRLMQGSSWTALCSKVDVAYDCAVCYPPKADVFRAFDLCAPENIKVVIIGQDPYHGPKQANGLAFSVHAGQKAPPSLRNILKEVWEDVNGMPLVDLTRWAEQGVFLLNTVLTVEEKKPGAHSGFGWDTFTDEVIRAISERRQHVVFMLWGNYAQKKEPLIDTRKHLVLKAPHPSPLSAYQGFFGCKHFSQANVFLNQHGCASIDW